MQQLRIFVSHSSADNTFCEALVQALRTAGADVWYDQQNIGTGQLTETITQELRSRTVFVLVLSKAAFASPWVHSECQWAFNLHQREPTRVILPVVAQAIAPSDFDAMLYMEGFKRVEGPGNVPYPPYQAIQEVLQLLQLPTDASQMSATERLIVQGAMLIDEKRYAEAVAVFTQASRESPDNAVVWDRLGFAYAKLEQWREALWACQRATALQPDVSDYWSNLCVALTGLSRHKDALAACERSLRLNPDNPAAWGNKAVILFKLNRMKDAVGALERALALAPGDPQIWVSKAGMLSFLKGDHTQETLQALDRAIALNPNFDRAWGEKALVLGGRRDNLAALACVDQAIAINPNNARHWIIKGLTLLRLQRYAEALVAADRCFELGPDNIEGFTRASVVSLRDAARKGLSASWRLKR